MTFPWSSVRLRIQSHLVVISVIPFDLVNISLSLFDFLFHSMSLLLSSTYIFLIELFLIGVSLMCPADCISITHPWPSSIFESFEPSQGSTREGGQDDDCLPFTGDVNSGSLVKMLSAFCTVVLAFVLNNIA